MNGVEVFRGDREMERSATNRVSGTGREPAAMLTPVRDGAGAKTPGEPWLLRFAGTGGLWGSR